MRHSFVHACLRQSHHAPCTPTAARGASTLAEGRACLAAIYLDGSPTESVPGPNSSSLGAVHGLGLGIERLALRRLAVDGHKAAHVERLARLLDGSEPALDAAPHALLRRSRGLLRDDLAALVLEETVLGQATARLGLGAPQDHGLGKLALGDLAHALSLHRLAGLRSLHRNHLLHRQSHGGKGQTGSGTLGKYGTLAPALSHREMNTTIDREPSRFRRPSASALLCTSARASVPGDPNTGVWKLGVSGKGTSLYKDGASTGPCT